MLREMFDRLQIRARYGRTLIFGGLLLTLLLCIRGAAAPDSYRFAILGDRTGEAQPGVYEQVWKEVAGENPAFVVSVGDTIQGMNDANAEAEWLDAGRILKPFRSYTLYLAPGNHDIWSEASERLFRQYSTHPVHYSFDYGQAHFTVLNNSRSEELPDQELVYLEADLKAHAGQALKIIVSHRPSWLLNVALRNPNFALHQLARRYGVQYVVAGHIHQMLRLELEGVTYLSMASSGGHLRLSGVYEDGWFFGHALVEVHGKNIDFQIRELSAPHGEGRITKLTDWGMAGLVKRGQRESAPAK
jgi:predicted phosphodiesterase